VSLLLRFDDRRARQPLRSGHVKSCACLRHENLNFVAAGARTAIDMLGKRFGRLVVTERAGSDQSHASSQSLALWRCICDCGTEITAVGAHLRRGSTRSCGCLRRRG
jgi:hypothetical protein